MLEKKKCDTLSEEELIIGPGILKWLKKEDLEG